MNLISEYKQLIPLIKSGISDNITLAVSIAESLDIDLLEFLKPYAALTQKVAPSLDNYITLFESTELDWATLGLDELPNNINELEQLQILNLQNNRLTNIDAIAGLFHLKELNLNRNKLVDLPQNLENWCQLESLLLSENYIKELPPSFSFCESLQQLVLSKNQLPAIPNSILQLKNLKFLDLVNNQLFYLPDEILAWQNLELLDLSYNKISELPASIGQLKNLRRLDLTYNPIESLPDELAELPHLEELVLHKVPFAAQERERLRELLPNTKIKINFDYFF